jgi:alpha-beta hydrolase superfamily lysophospholipase
MRYLLGESMGGALALLLHRNKPYYWDGAVLVAPMCKVCAFIGLFFLSCLLHFTIILVPLVLEGAECHI